MADNSENILERLQQHNMQPPADAFDKAWGSIVQQAENTSVNPSSENMEQKIFTELQEYSLAAPPLDFAALKKSKASPKRTFAIPMPLLRAASVLLVLGAGAVLYFTVFRKNDTGIAEYAAGSKGGSSIAATDAKKSDSLKTAVAVLTPAVSGIKNTTANETVKKKWITGRAFSKKANSSKVTFSNGSEAKLYDNDVLLTLTSYSGNGWQQFFTEAVKDKKITLNKFAYMNLSDKMVEMLQQTYLTKKNGTPSRKAKKIKKKFDKWRKKDEKYFDKNMQKNPADIIDLSDFIL